MAKREIVLIECREAWRNWLAANHGRRGTSWVGSQPPSEWKPVITSGGNSQSGSQKCVRLPVAEVNTSLPN